ncbi:MAG: D-alanine--D-alanine ligase [Acidobacteria bacterium]|jgi:D-alanine-D-alanine ligase|nr:D-alanine--D-alanine ligase [Acidobacteriota bacterium]
MRIGLTYDLREDYLAAGLSPDETAEFDKIDTIDGIDRALTDLGHETDRIGNVKALVTRLSMGDTWDLVFNIAEGVAGFGRESQVPALLEAYEIPYTFSDPLVLAVSLHKGMAKQIARTSGVPTPDFAVVEDVFDVPAIDLAYPLFVKPVAEGTGKGITAASRVSRRGQLLRVCRSLLEAYRQPVLVETYLPGVEHTVGILGTGRHARVLGVMEVRLDATAEEGAYSYLNKENYEQCVSYLPAHGPAADAAAEVALAAWRCLGCRDAGRVDIRADACGKPSFMEVNPLAGLNPVHSDLPILCRLNGISYLELISAIVSETSARAGGRTAARRPQRALEQAARALAG